MTAMICERCGAPLEGSKCEYCGSIYDNNDNNDNIEVDRVMRDERLLRMFYDGIITLNELKELRGLPRI